MDIKIPLAAMLVVGGAIGLALPGEGEVASTADGQAARAEMRGDPQRDLQLNRVTASPPAPTLPGWGEEIVLHREPDGHFYADVSVEGREFRMLVDTGARVVALTGEDASAMGLHWFDEDVAPVAQGASGAVHGVNTTINRMALGSLEAQGVRAIIMPDSTGISLLGQSFLSTVGRVEISGDRMVLGN